MDLALAPQADRGALRTVESPSGCTPVPGMQCRLRAHSAAIPVTVSGECETHADMSAATGSGTWEGVSRAMTRKPGDRPACVALARLRDWPGAERLSSERRHAAGAAANGAVGCSPLLFRAPAHAEDPALFARRKV